MVNEQLNSDKWEYMKTVFAKIFLKKTRIEWENVFRKIDCCVTPVLNL